MKKSLKRFLVITQVLGWSALLASACTNNDVNSANNRAVTNTNDKNHSSDPSVNTKNDNSNHDQTSTLSSENSKKDVNQKTTQNNQTGDVSAEKEKKTTEQANNKPNKPAATIPAKNNMATSSTPDTEEDAKANANPSKTETTNSEISGSNHVTPGQAPKKKIVILYLNNKILHLKNLKPHH